MSDFRKAWKQSHTPTAAEQLAGRVDELRSTLRVQDPALVAARSGSSWLTPGPGRGELHVPLWDKVCILCWPQLTGWNEKDDRLPDFQLALLLYYLLTSDGTPLTGRWVSFADLPDGRMYNAAFQSYSGDEIVKRLDPVGWDAIPPERIINPLHEFNKACLSIGGEPIDIGSASFSFHALPRVPLMLTYWLGDEDFPSSCKVLFDASVSHYLPIDACAVLGSMLTGRVLRAKA